ncbi:MAG: hypothetical protein ACKVJF_05795 [Flavobacteriales bacterium]
MPAFTFLFSVRVYWDSPNPVIEIEEKQKMEQAPAFTFLFSVRVHWNDVNPVLEIEDAITKRDMLTCLIKL